MHNFSLNFYLHCKPMLFMTTAYQRGKEMPYFMYSQSFPNTSCSHLEWAKDRLEEVRQWWTKNSLLKKIYKVQNWWMSGCQSEVLTWEELVSPERVRRYLISAAMWGASFLIMKTFSRLDKLVSHDYLLTLPWILVPHPGYRFYYS